MIFSGVISIASAYSSASFPPSSLTCSPVKVVRLVTLTLRSLDSDRV